MEVDLLLSGWGCCITLGSCGGMSSREVVRCFEKLRARQRIERKSVGDEVRERCRGGYIQDLDRELRKYCQAEENTD